MDDMTNSKDAEFEAARTHFRESITRAEGSVPLMALGAAVCAPRGGNDAQVHLKTEAALDAFKQGFQLLRDLMDGK